MNTEIVRISEAEVSTSNKHIIRAGEIIRNGGLVVFPTETVYGLGADATQGAAASKIFAAKGRPSDNPLIIHVAHPADAEGYTHTNELYYKLAERFMPGPLTIVLPSKDTVSKNTRGGLSTVAVRCPSNPIARALIECAGVPIAAPSANLSGSPSPTTAQHVVDDMMGRVDMIIDGGEADFGLESTIVKIEDNDTLTLLRPGRITVEELSLVSDVVVADAVTDLLKEGEVALSPGMKYRHYAPTAPVHLLDGEVVRCIEYIREQGDKRVAVLCYSEDAAIMRDALAYVDFYEFGSRSDLVAQAHRLFALLREVDKHNYDQIYAPLPEKSGVGLALYNRLIRAAAHKVIKLR